MHLSIYHYTWLIYSNRGYSTQKLHYCKVVCLVPCAFRSCGFIKVFLVVFLQELGAGITEPDENLSLLELERFLRRAVVKMEKEVKERQNILEELKSQEQVSVERLINELMLNIFLMMMMIA